MSVVPSIRPSGGTHLFADARLDDFIRTRSASLVEEIERLPESVVLGAGEDELVTDLAESYRIDVPTLVKEDISQSEPREAKVDARTLPDRFIRDASRAVLVDATTFAFTVPFTGDPKVLKLRASTYSINPPIADIGAWVLEFPYTLVKPNAEALKRSFEQEIALIEEALAWTTQDVEAFNASVEEQALKLLSARRERLRNNAELSTALGYPLRRRSDAPRTYTVPARRKRLPRGEEQSPQASEPSPLEPEITVGAYEDILSIMDNMVTVMELSPHAFTTMSEEDLRTHFLVQLNGQYEGGATGETFNYEGKSDILIKVDGKNVFIAECMIWQGPKSLRGKLDQMLGYASWRDTKTAIIVFSRQKDFSAVLAKIPGALKEHPNVVGEVEVIKETRFEAAVMHRDDTDRVLTLTVLAYNVPTTGLS